MTKTAFHLSNFATHTPTPLLAQSNLCTKPSKRKLINSRCRCLLRLPSTSSPTSTKSGSLVFITYSEKSKIAKSHILSWQTCSTTKNTKCKATLIITKWTNFPTWWSSLALSWKTTSSISGIGWALTLPTTSFRRETKMAEPGELAFLLV